MVVEGQCCLATLPLETGTFLKFEPYLLTCPFYARSSGFFLGFIFINLWIPKRGLRFLVGPLFCFSSSPEVETFHSTTTEGLHMASLGGALLFDLGC